MATSRDSGKKKFISFVPDDEVLAILDKLTRGGKINRSAVIRNAIKAYYESLLGS